jgi:hypothetical protein
LSTLDRSVSDTSSQNRETSNLQPSDPVRSSSQLSASQQIEIMQAEGDLVVCGDEKQAVILSDFNGDPDEGTVSVREGESVFFLEANANGWVTIRHPISGEVGFVPETFLEVVSAAGSKPDTPPVNIPISANPTTVGAADVRANPIAALAAAMASPPPSPVQGRMVMDGI